MLENLSAVLIERSVAVEHEVIVLLSNPDLAAALCSAV